MNFRVTALITNGGKERRAETRRFDLANYYTINYYTYASANPEGRAFKAVNPKLLERALVYHSLGLK